MTSAQHQTAKVTNLLEARERRQPPTVCIEVEGGQAGFFCALYREVEPLALVRSEGPSDPDWTPRLHARTRIEFAEQVARDSRGPWAPYLSVLTGPLPPEGWRPPMVSSFAQLVSFARAVAGQLFLKATLSALDNQAWTNRSQERMQEWRVGMFGCFRNAIDRVLLRRRMDPSRTIVRTAPLVDAESGENGEVPADAPECGFAIEVWPLQTRNISFATGLEAVRARLALGLHVDDGAHHDAIRAAGGWIAGEALTAASLRALDPAYGD
jgi:hypothetical protein